MDYRNNSTFNYRCALLLILCVLVAISVRFIYTLDPYHKSDPHISAVIKIQKNKFDGPSRRSISRNTAIRFVNKDIVRHTIVCDSDHVRNSTLLGISDSFVCVFKVPGEYRLYSSLYTKMDPLDVVVV